MKTFDHTETSGSGYASTSRGSNYLIDGFKVNGRFFLSPEHDSGFIHAGVGWAVGRDQSVPRRLGTNNRDHMIVGPTASLGMGYEWRISSHIAAHLQVTTRHIISGGAHTYYATADTILGFTYYK